MKDEEDEGKKKGRRKGKSRRGQIDRILAIVVLTTTTETVVINGCHDSDVGTRPYSWL